MSPSRVLIADDHQLIRQALRRALADAGFDVVSEAGDGEQAVRLTRQLHPDIVVMDLSMPVLDGMEATRRIHEDDEAVKVVVLTMHSDDHLLVDALHAGAVAYLTKACSMHEVVETVELIDGGEVLLSSELASSILQDMRRAGGSGDGGEGDRGRAGRSPLTPREEEVLQLVADGRSTTELADELYISAKTVKNHLASIYTKLEARDRTQAVLSAVRLGIVHLN